MYELVADILKEISLGREVPINETQAFVVVEYDGHKRFGVKNYEDKIIAVIDPNLSFLVAIVEYNMTDEAKDNLRMNRILS